MNAPGRYLSAISRPASPRARRDPLTIILGTGDRWDLITLCLALAFLLHGAMLVVAILASLLKDLHFAVEDNRHRLHEYFWRQYDVDIEKPKDQPKPEPAPPEPPPPEPAPVPKAEARPKEDDPYKDAKPIPAQAAKVLTAAPKDDDPVELPTIVSGEGNALGGVQSGEGKGDRITMNKSAALDGTPGGRGTVAKPPPPPPPAEDKSRQIGLVGGSAWNCPFPPEADAEQIDQAVVGVQITVRPDGSALSATVVSDPGHGFGRAARACALSRKYVPALSRSGEPIVGLNLVNVRFSR